MKTKARLITTTNRVGSTAWLSARRIKYDPTGTGRPRYTHEPTGQAAVRQPYMDDEMWQKKIEAFGRAMERENQRS